MLSPSSSLSVERRAEKSEPGTDFSDVVVEAAKTIASGLNKQPIERLDELAVEGKLKEICNAKEKN
jgi:hypothetical protein